jgi:hypothetical protein
MANNRSPGSGLKLAQGSNVIVTKKIGRKRARPSHREQINLLERGLILVSRAYDDHVKPGYAPVGVPKDSQKTSFVDMGGVVLSGAIRGTGL